MKFGGLVWRSIRSRRSSLLSFAVFVFWSFIAFLPSVFPNQFEVDVHLPLTRLPPSFHLSVPSGWMGYDAVGSSILLQIVNGASVSLVVGSATVLVSMAIGVPLGAVAGYFGGWVDLLVGRVMDILLAFPPLVLPLAIAVFFGGGFSTVVFALCVGGWIGSAKIVRSQFRTLKNSDFVMAAKAAGASPARVMFRHLLPNVASPLLVHATFSMAGAILAEAGLSFLGLGLGDGHISWGGLLNDARSYLIESPHMAIFPALSILSLVLALNDLGESFRIALDPRQSDLTQGD
ncbi:ABC transporter permease [bacterium]|nr:ABC transporter permease [bacterium]